MARNPGDVYYAVSVIHLEFAFRTNVLKSNYRLAVSFLKLLRYMNTLDIYMYTYEVYFT